MMILMRGWVLNANGVKIVGASGLLVLTSVLHSQLNQVQIRDSTFRDAAPSLAIAWPPELTRALSLGWLPVSVDWFWLKSFMDPSLEPVSPGVHPPAYRYISTVIRLDPDFWEAYVSGAHYLAVIRNDVSGAEDLLNRAESFRREGKKLRHGYAEWQVPLLLAYLHLFERGDLSAAAEHFRTASEIAGAPAYLRSLAHRFSLPGGHYAVALRLLEFMRKNVADTSEGDTALAVLDEKLRSLRVAAFMDELRRSIRLREFRASRLSFPAFLRKMKIATTDPWGGTLGFDEKSGDIVTSTPYQSVLGLR